MFNNCYPAIFWAQITAVFAIDSSLSGNCCPVVFLNVKERKFYIGYEIERFRGLLVAYRSAADGMPQLNAAVLEDLGRLA